MGKRRVKFTYVTSFQYVLYEATAVIVIAIDGIIDMHLMEKKKQK